MAGPICAENTFPEPTTFINSLLAPANSSCRSSRCVGRVARPRSVTRRESRLLDTPPVNQAASWVVVTAVEVVLGFSEECAGTTARTNRQRISEALTLTELPNSWIGLRAAASERECERKRLRKALLEHSPPTFLAVR